MLLKAGALFFLVEKGTCRACAAVPPPARCQGRAERKEEAVHCCAAPWSCCGPPKEANTENKPCSPDSPGPTTPHQHHSCACAAFSRALCKLFPAINTCITPWSSLALSSLLLNTSHAQTHTSILCLLYTRPEEGCTGSWSSWEYLQLGDIYGMCKTNRWMCASELAEGTGDGGWGLEWVERKAREWTELHRERLGTKWKCWMPGVGVKGKQTLCLCNIKPPRYISIYSMQNNAHLCTVYEGRRKRRKEDYFQKKEGGYFIEKSSSKKLNSEPAMAIHAIYVPLQFHTSSLLRI